ncbi:MAG: cyclic nucleotide-binding/CBS domain-containing protein [Candidatus Hydrothermarchaeaceae archaeon]
MMEPEEARFGEKKVRELMQEDVITVKSNTLAREVVKTLRKQGISGVVVVDMVGEILGVISTLDVFKMLGTGERANSLVAEDIMTPFAINITPENTVVEAASAMLENNIHRLVVVASPTRRRPIGIITATDIVNNI